MLNLIARGCASVCTLVIGFVTVFVIAAMRNLIAKGYAFVCNFVIGFVTVIVILRLFSYWR
jgi:hypothetical protein